MTATHEELLDAIELAFKNHDLWCGHKADSPGDGSINDAQRAVEELRHRLSPGAYWPQATFEVAQELFGGAVLNTASRTYQALDRRIRFALRVWDEKFGPLTPEQEVYADQVLASVLRKAKSEAGGAKVKLWPYAQAGIGRAVHNDRVTEGMRKRQTYVDPAKILEELAA